MPLKSSISGFREGLFVPIPRDQVARIFSHVAIRRIEKDVEVVFNLLVPPAEEWNTVVAIDASESMRPLWGKTLTGDIPLSVQANYHQKNWVTEEDRDGERRRMFQPEAYDDAISQGYLRWTGNEVEPKARELLEFLSGTVDANDASNLFYFGCDKGTGWMDLGEIRREDSGQVLIPGPEPFAFGRESRLLPLVQYLVAKASVVPRTMVVLLTDGRISDLEDVQSYSSSLAILIKAKELNFLRFVAIGMGRDVDQKTLSALGGLKIDGDVELWSFKMAADLQDPCEIFAGLAPDDRIVAPNALIFDANGKTVKEFRDGLPGKGTFRMPLNSPSFTIQVFPGEKKYQQTLLLPFLKDLL